MSYPPPWKPDPPNNISYEALKYIENQPKTMRDMWNDRIAFDDFPDFIDFIDLELIQDVFKYLPFNHLSDVFPYGDWRGNVKSCGLCGNSTKIKLVCESSLYITPIYWHNFDFQGWVDGLDTYLCTECLLLNTEEAINFWELEELSIEDDPHCYHCGKYTEKSICWMMTTYFPPTTCLDCFRNIVRNVVQDYLEPIRNLIIPPCAGIKRAK